MERNVPDAAFFKFWQIARHGWPLVELGYNRTEVNRNRLARTLLDSDYTHILMLDLDHRHPEDIVERLGRWVIEDPEILVVGGLNFQRGQPFSPCIFVLGDDGKLHFPINWEPGLARVDGIGTASLLISRKVFELLPFPWFQSIMNEDKGYPGEDMWFCRLCHENGINMYCDTTTTSPHLLLTEVDEEAFRNYVSEFPPKDTIQVTKKN